MNELNQAYHALGLRPGMDVALPLPAGSNPAWEDLQSLRLRELQREHVALVARDGLPGSTWLVCGDTADDVRRRLPRARPGPNGPVDGVEWLRGGS